MNDLNILIIEDEPMIMLITKKMLEDAGYKPGCATTGSQAIELVNSSAYDLILSDIGLPDTSGIELAKKIRMLECLHSRRKSIIYAITAFRLEDVRNDCFLAGVNEVLEKPLTRTTLDSILNFVGSKITPKKETNS